MFIWERWPSFFRGRWRVLFQETGWHPGAVPNVTTEIVTNDSEVSPAKPFGCSGLRSEGGQSPLHSFVKGGSDRCHSQPKVTNETTTSFSTGLFEDAEDDQPGQRS